MKKITITSIITIFLGIVSPMAIAQLPKFSITASITNVDTRKGTIYANLTNDEENFPAVKNNIASQKVTISAEGEIQLKFTNIPAGKYAIVLYQDLNDNKTLDLNGQMPAEPFGFSQITMLLGPPNFEQCSFTLDENKIMEIALISF